MTGAAVAPAPPRSGAAAGRHAPIGIVVPARWMRAHSDRGGGMVGTAALALLAVASAEPRLAVELRLAPPFALAADAPAPPDLSAAAPEPARPGLAAPMLAAAAGIALADLVSVGLMLPAFACAVETGTGTCSSGLVVPMLVAGAVGLLFLPPAMGVWFARSATGGERATRAYWLAFLVRLGGMVLAGAGPIGAVAFAVTEFVVTPYVIVRVLQAPAAPPPPAASAARRAIPERDPALAWRLR